MNTRAVRHPTRDTPTAGLFVYRKTPNGNRTEIREFICGTLTEPLKRDSFYQVQVFVKPDEESNVECDGFGVAFTREHVYHQSTDDIYRLRASVMRPKKSLVPRQENWTVVSGTFHARGRERFIILGNLKLDALTMTNPVQKTASEKRDNLHQGKTIYPKRDHSKRRWVQ